MQKGTKIALWGVGGATALGLGYLGYRKYGPVTVTMPSATSTTASQPGPSSTGSAATSATTSATTSAATSAATSASASASASTSAPATSQASSSSTSSSSATTTGSAQSGPGSSNTGSTSTGSGTTTPANKIVTVDSVTVHQTTLLAALASITVPTGFTGYVSVPIAGHGTGFPTVHVVNGVYEGPGGPITLKQAPNPGGTTQPKGVGGTNAPVYTPLGTLTASSSGLSRLQEATAHTTVPTDYTGYVKVQLPNGNWTEEYVVHGTFDGVALPQSTSAGGSTLNGVYIPSTASQSAAASAYTSAAANPDPFVAALHAASVPTGFTGNLTLHLSNGSTTTIYVANGVYDGPGGPLNLAGGTTLNQ